MKIKKLFINNRGFTLIELIVVISIVLIFSGLSMVRYNTFSSQQKLKSEAKKLVDVIELAKKKAITSDLQDRNCQNFNGYKLTLNSNSYWLFFCCNSICTNINPYDLGSDINIVSGTGDLNFPPLMIGANLSNNPIRLRNSTLNQCVDIFVSSIGVVEFNETLIGC